MQGLQCDLTWGAAENDVSKGVALTCSSFLWTLRTPDPPAEATG